jgi:hypothetical protein
LKEEEEQAEKVYESKEDRKARAARFVLET